MYFFSFLKLFCSWFDFQGPLTLDVYSYSPGHWALSFPFMLLRKNSGRIMIEEGNKTHESHYFRMDKFSLQRTFFEREFQWNYLSSLNIIWWKFWIWFFLSISTMRTLSRNVIYFDMLLWFAVIDFKCVSDSSWIQTETLGFLILPGSSCLNCSKRQMHREETPRWHH